MELSKVNHDRPKSDATLRVRRVMASYATRIGRPQLALCEPSPSACPVREGWDLAHLVEQTDLLPGPSMKWRAIFRTAPVTCLLIITHAVRRFCAFKYPQPLPRFAQNLAMLGCVEFPSGIAPSRLRILAGIHVLRSSSHFISHRLGAILV